MLVNRSLGGIGKLYLGDTLMGDVYYNIRQDQPPDSLECSVVFVGKEVELPPDLAVGATQENGRGGCYRLFLEDGRYLIVTVSKKSSLPHAPYICTSCDGLFHSTLTFVRS
jgi:hypothetical protein